MCGRVCILSFSTRHSLSVGVACLNLLLANVGDVVTMVALYIKFLLESHLAVVLGSHGGALSYFLLAVGLLQNFVCVSAAKVNYDAGCLETCTPRTCRRLLFTLCCQVLTLVLLLVAIIMCLVHKALIHDVLPTGFLAAMKLYRMNDHVKAGLNRIQAEYQCCGSRSMMDWFKIPWIPLAFLNVDHPEVNKRIIDGEFVTDDAPYSCCDVHVTRPCVHHQVQNISAHRLVGPGGTLYSMGCADRLEDYWKASILSPVLGLLVLIFLLMLLAVLLSRLLQTSLQDALDKGSPTSNGDAYCCKSGWPCTIWHHSYFKGNKKVKTADGGDHSWGLPWQLPWRKSNNKPANMNQSAGIRSGSGDCRPLGIDHNLARITPDARYHSQERGRGLSLGGIGEQTHGQSLNHSRSANHSRDRSHSTNRRQSLSHDRFRDQKQYWPKKLEVEPRKHHQSPRDRAETRLWQGKPQVQ